MPGQVSAGARPPAPAERDVAAGHRGQPQALGQAGGRGEIRAGQRDSGKSSLRNGEDLAPSGLILVALIGERISRLPTIPEEAGHIRPRACLAVAWPASARRPRADRATPEFNSKSGAAAVVALPHTQVRDLNGP